MIVKKRVSSKKYSRHHLLLVSVFVLIILLALAAFILQRSTNIKAIAGEAIAKRITETKQLALTEGEIKIVEAVQQGKDTVQELCPLNLGSSEDQHWKLTDGWKILPLRYVDVQCANNRVSCYYVGGYYAPDELEINRAHQIITYQEFKGVDNCIKSALFFNGCDCEIKPGNLLKS